MTDPNPDLRPVFLAPTAPTDSTDSTAPTGAVRPLLVVDAANVIGSRPDGWWHDRAGAAHRLLTSLAACLAGPGIHTDIIVILEGAARAAADEPVADTPSTLHVVLAKGSGDDTIVEVVTTALQQHPDRPTTVITADRGLRSRVEPLGAATAGPSHLWSLLD
ncbi:hypothetical protein [Kribbella flavida]|uniref:hypothetical protein n=1 Tax=Kribbella flavida TaxID=182640 RepID=UPI001ED9492C|nr:hypothetical protein [Kribbella flavida]